MDIVTHHMPGILSLKSILEKEGAKKSKFDDSVFYLYDNNKLQGVICSHVYDSCWGGTVSVENY